MVILQSQFSGLFLYSFQPKTNVLVVYVKFNAVSSYTQYHGVLKIVRLEATGVVTSGNQMFVVSVSEDFRYCLALVRFWF